MCSIHIQFFINREFKEADIPPNTTVLEYIRNYAGLTGTKLGCGEGDCGTCTIAMGQLINDKMVYKAINSCLVPAAKMHYKHIVTIEGISDGKHLHPLQTAILENHATQCGFCTPGITMSLFSYFSENKQPDNNDLRLALEGNLCRCTGYQAIKNAADWSMSRFAGHPFEYPAYFEGIKQKIKQLVSQNETNSINESYYLPKTKKALFLFLEQHPDATIVSGATDLFIERNLHDVHFKKLADLSEIAELHIIDFIDNRLIIGGSATLTEILSSNLVKKHLPILHDALELMASKQIRNIATLSGNIANASPVADSVPALLAANAVLQISSINSERIVPLKDFFLGYKQTDLDKNEIIEKIEIPVHQGLRFSFEKSSKRKAVDISTVNSALSIRVEKKIIRKINIAYGGIAPTPVKFETIEQFLLNKPFNEELILKAAEMAANTVKPITDMRGSESYRKILVKNHLIKHLHKLFSEII